MTQVTPAPNSQTASGANSPGAQEVAECVLVDQAEVILALNQFWQNGDQDTLRALFDFVHNPTGTLDTSIAKRLLMSGIPIDYISRQIRAWAVPVIQQMLCERGRFIFLKKVSVSPV